MRYAIYFTPEATDGLRVRAEQWLADHTVTARGYGFHATLKAPFHLAAGRTEQQLGEAFHRFASAHRPIGSVPGRLALLGSFFAIVPRETVPRLMALADDSVDFFDGFRAPASQEETDRRHPALLSERQRANLRQWGYPYVFDDFRFHLTLTDRVDATGRDDVERLLAAHLGDWLAPDLAIDAITLARQPAAGEPFEEIARESLTLKDSPDGPDGPDDPALAGAARRGAARRGAARQPESHQPESEQRTPGR
jgi:hypothetical protein